jgi:hypothetical protein
MSARNGDGGSGSGSAGGVKIVLRRTSSTVMNPIRRLTNINRLQITGGGEERNCVLM